MPSTQKTQLRSARSNRSAVQSLGASDVLQPLVEKFGAPKLVPLDIPLRESSQLNYLDLLPKQAAHKGAGLHAVAEHQGMALLYLVDGRGTAHSIGPKRIQELQRLLANRSESAWLGIVKAGSLELYPVEFAREIPNKPATTIRERDTDAPMFFQSLVHGTFRESKRLQASDHVYRQIVDLLKHTTDSFVPTRKLDGLEVLSMAGRALFFRFLHDRHIVERQELGDICPSAAHATGATLLDCFSDAQRAAETSAWLDMTFNGDFLPLPLGSEGIPSEDRLRRQKAYVTYYKEVQRKTGGRFFAHLDAIMHGWDAIGESTYQPPLDWNDFQFAHIPVGVLSEVYEHFCHKVDAKLAADTSVHYTPRFIAQFMVQEAFGSMPDDARAHARVLDPACGAGIFLVLSFRKLFEAAWQTTNQRPDKKVIQRILYEQLRGFDVSEPALRLSALALYITAIELNATQRPPSELKMPRNLRGTVLHHFGPETAREVYGSGQKAEDEGMLGSLGELPSRDGLENFDGAFDLVIGNPPWTRLRDDLPSERRARSGTATPVKDSPSKRANKTFTALAQRVLKSRDLADLGKSYSNPDKAPDIPFLWRAAEWAKPGAAIAFAMHARLFLHTQGRKDVFWQAAQRAFAFTGILNGADLRKTAVWAGMDVPWCLVFARNQIAHPGTGFYFSTPSYERSVNGTGRFRIDYASVNPLRTTDLEARPWLLKTLTLGTWLDVEVMERIVSAFGKTLEERWEEWDATGDKTGKGYVRSPNLRQKSADFLGKLKDFEEPQHGSFEIGWGPLKTYLQKYGSAEAYRPKTPAQYEPPLVVLPKAPGDNPYSPKAFVADKKVAFSQSYYGYSCKGHSDADSLAALIHVLAHSTLGRYFVLMRSASLGSDFMMFLKADFDAISFPDPSSLSLRQKKSVIRLSERLREDEGRMPGKEDAEEELLLPEFRGQRHSARSERQKALKLWKELNDFIFGLYGLGEDDVQIIEDTLFASAPYRRAGEDAFKPTEPAHRAEFCAELQSRLQPFFDVTGETVQVGEPQSLRQDAWDHSWRFVTAWVGQSAPSVPTGLIAAAMRDANETGASMVTIRTQGPGLLLGLLDARRWWTRSRALLCARHVIQDKLSCFDETPHHRRH